jgi:hypothetical protein
LPPLKFAVLKGTGFSPYIQPNNHDRALAPEGNGPAIFMVSGGTPFHARLRLLFCDAGDEFSVTGHQEEAKL